MARHRPNWRFVKRHRSYSVGEVAKLMGVSKLTVRRWIKEGLPALTDKRPTLILGADLVEFLKGRKGKKTKLELDEFYCFRCRCRRTAAGNMLDYTERAPGRGTLTGLCSVCVTVMYKAFSAAKLPELCRIAEVSFPHGRAHLIEMGKPIANDYFR